MALRTVLDTNAILYFLGGRLAQPLPRAEYLTSIICEIELLSYPVLDATALKQVRSFLSEIRVVPLTEPVKEATIDLRKAHGLKIPDAIVAATARTASALLLTNDVHLLRLPGINAQSLTLKRP